MKLEVKNINIKDAPEAYKGKSGIYTITNDIDKKKYIGSSQHSKLRFNGHKSQLENGIHFCTYLQRAVNKYGIDNFTFEMIEECDPDKLVEREQYWIDFYGFKNLYNSRPVAEANRGHKFPYKPRPLTEEHKEAIRKAAKARKGQPSPLKGIPNGRTPWNKGTKGVMKANKASFKPGVRNSPKTEFKKGISNNPDYEWEKGHIPWNKDKKGVMPTPWNKDKKGVMPEPWNKGLAGKGICKSNSGSFKKGECVSPKTQFRKGAVPWNKGKNGYKMPEGHNCKGAALKPFEIVDPTGKYLYKGLGIHIFSREMNLNAPHLTAVMKKDPIRKQHKGWTAKKEDVEYEIIEWVPKEQKQESK